MGNIITELLDFIFPRRCLKCSKILDTTGYLCDDCAQNINFITPPYCERCGAPLYGDLIKKCPDCLKKKRRFYRLARSAMIYDESSKGLITSFKFKDKTENAKLLAVMLKVAGKDIFNSDVDLIIPVPLHYTRLIKRRYNQAAVLAQELSLMVNIPVDCQSLIRHRKTRPQVELSGQARISNVRNAFSVNHFDKIKNKRIVLIDDVTTTGSTLKESAKALKKAGAKSVDVLTLARTL
ncbi:MAG: ComF family protein [Alphaproteobacteria bacterium]|nr:ComF family protein [Alphaproteobacteria bacterium]